MSTVQLLHPADETKSNERVSAIRKAKLEIDSAVETTGNSDLRARILSFGALDDPDASPMAVLACALSIIHPAHIAELLAKQLMDTFASIGAILSAPREQIRSAIPHSDITFLVLRAMHTLSSISLREEFERKINLSTYSSLQKYLRMTLAHKDVEVVRLLLMDVHNGLIRDDLHAEGTGNRVLVSPRDIVTRALKIGAYGLIIVHNHPSGDPKPSVDDIEMTKELERVLKIFGITLHDSIIVGRYGCYSLKSAGLL